MVYAEQTKNKWNHFRVVIGPSALPQYHITPPCRALFCTVRHGLFLTYFTQLVDVSYLVSIHNYKVYLIIYYLYSYYYYCYYCASHDCKRSCSGACAGTGHTVDTWWRTSKLGRKIGAEFMLEFVQYVCICTEWMRYINRTSGCNWP